MIDAQPSAVEHPSREVLVEFGSGKLADLAFESVAGHLSRCDTCLSIVADLHARSTADFLEERVRDCLVAPEFRATVTYADAARTPAVSTTSVVAQEGWVGQMVGRYLILKRLGVGGMGVVYLAEDPAVGRAVALKMISAEDMTKTNRLERFRSEGRALARVRHPNVVQFFHFDEHGGHPYFTMEFVDGTSLADRLPGNPLPIREAVELVRTLASAVHALHGQGVIHRDIKPSNILIEADGTPKIADFGLAKLADATGQADRTQTGMVMGTPSYMSPEQAEGRIRDIDLRADVYSLGAVLYAALTGRPPHKGNSVHDTLRLVSTAIPVPPSRGRPDVPKVLDRICEKCLEKSPGRRYPTAQALADDLEDWLEGRPPRGLPGAVGRALRPTRRQALVAGLGLAAFATGVVIYRRDPDVIMANIQADLKAGKQVKLIGDKGSPRWFQWVAGERKGKLETTKDGVFSVRAGDDVALIELMPDPMIDSYRLQVQVRHDAAEIREMSEVGLFVARQGHPVGAAEAQFFIQFSANDILTVADRRVFILPNGQAVPGPEASYLTLRPHLYGADGSAPNTRMSAAISPPIIPAGEAAGVWRTLEVTVTPAGVECAWDNTPLSLSGDDVRQRIAWTARITVGNPVLQNLAPAYVPRGGLGLFVSWGTASFRSATITPLVC